MNAKRRADRAANLGLVGLEEKLALPAPLAAIRQRPVALDSAIAASALKASKSTSLWDRLIPAGEMGAELLEGVGLAAAERADALEVDFGHLKSRQWPP